MLKGVTKVNRSDLNDIMKDASLYDGNFRHWLKNTNLVGVREDLIELKAPGRDEAKKFINEVYDDGKVDKWKLGSPAKKRKKKIQKKKPMSKFTDFCRHSNIDSQKNKIDCVILLMYFEISFNLKEGLTITEINKLFEKAHLPLYNRTYLKRDLSKDRRVTKVSKSDKFKLTYTTLQKYDTEFSFLKDEEIEIKVSVNLNATPLLNEHDLEGAQKMSQLYIIMYCWENSVRNFIQETLKNKIGVDWWDKTKNKDLKKNTKTEN